MDLLSFVTTVVIVTASGVLAPGPLFFAAVTHGTRSGAKGGLAFSSGHALVEFPLVLLLALGLLTVADQPAVKLITGVAGGLALLLFGALQIRDTLTKKAGQTTLQGITSRSPLLIGLLFTGLNPYFIVWWLTVGGELIRRALTFASLAGVVIMFLSHIWLDYVWLTAVAHLAKTGTHILGTRGYRAIMIAFGAALIYFGVSFLISAL
jgi:threonine/homoserine/homoserine lactone efflux protein